MKNLNRKTALIGLCISILIAILAVQVYSSSIGLARGSTGTTSGLTGTNGNSGITVQGTGEASIQPDRGIVTIGIITTAATAEGAVQNNANNANAVISALNSIGINSSEIQTVYYYISPQWTCCSSPSNLTGYQVTNEFQVTVIASGQSLEQLGTDIGHAIDTAASHGANQIYGVQFTASTSALQQAQQTALTLATLDASQKAHTIASALGVDITGVESVTTSPSYYPPILGIQSAAPVATPVQPPQSLTVTATVTATFSIS